MPAQIIAKLEELSELVDPATHPDVKVMRAEWNGCWRLRVGEYWAIFELAELTGKRLRS